MPEKTTDCLKLPKGKIDSRIIKLAEIIEERGRPSTFTELQACFKAAGSSGSQQSQVETKVVKEKRVGDLYQKWVSSFLDAPKESWYSVTLQQAKQITKCLNLKAEALGAKNELQTEGVLSKRELQLYKFTKTVANNVNPRAVPIT